MDYLVQKINGKKYNTQILLQFSFCMKSYLDHVFCLFVS